MRRILIAAATLMAAYSFSPQQAFAQAPPPTPVVVAPYMHFPWWVFACPGSIMFSAAVAAVKDHRELTNWEAYTCGVLYWFGAPPKQYVHKFRHSLLIEPAARLNSVG